MRITQWGEYGLLCSIQLAQCEQESAETTIGASEIAAKQQIALDYTQQILQRLRKGGIVQSVRGPHGGYRLARPAAQLTLGQILRAAEGETFEVICETKPLSPSRCSAGSVCNLRPIWHELRDHVNSFLETRTLQDVIEHPEIHPVESSPIQIGARAAQGKRKCF